MQKNQQAIAFCTEKGLRYELTKKKNKESRSERFEHQGEKYPPMLGVYGFFDYKFP